MRQDQHRPQATGGAGMALGMLFLIGILIAFGVAVYAWMRIQAAERAAVLAQQARAEAMAHRARARFARARRRELDRAPVDTSVDDAMADREISVSLDAEGNVQVHGATVALEDVAGELLVLARHRPDEWKINIWADEKCDVDRLTELLTACKEAGFADVQIAADPHAVVLPTLNAIPQREIAP